MKTRSIFSLLSAITFVTMVTACDPTPNRENTTEVAEDQNEEVVTDNLEDESEFLVEAASGGLYEIEMAKLAQQKAQSQEVKDLANRLLEDHTQANEKLKQLATSKGINVPAAMGDEEQRKYNQFSEMATEEFDEDYIEQMVKDHKDDISEFEEAAEDLDDPDVKAFASSTLPALKEHLSIAEQLEENVNM